MTSYGRIPLNYIWSICLLFLIRTVLGSLLIYLNYITLTLSYLIYWICIGLWHHLSWLIHHLVGCRLLINHLINWGLLVHHLVNWRLLIHHLVRLWLLIHHLVVIITLIHSIRWNLIRSRKCLRWYHHRRWLNNNDFTTSRNWRLM